MRKLLLISAAMALSACNQSAVSPAPDLQVTGAITPELSTRFSRLALDCVQREYPNKISHVMADGGDVGAPSDLFPAFYGCFDWHSSVHGHWLLVRLLHVGEPDAAWREEAIAKLSASFTPENIAGEVAYMTHPNRGSFERPYGLAWYLQLMAELREMAGEGDKRAAQWLDTLKPLEAVIVTKIKIWLPNLAYPIRLGTHNQSAFAFGLIYDWAEVSGDQEMLTMIRDKSLAFHAGDKDCNMAYEPSGEDFLSPCLMTADLMRRVMSAEDFKVWFDDFLPSIPAGGGAQWLAPGIVKDATDGKLVHLDGVNLSRAWNLQMIAVSLGEDDPRYAALMAAADNHRDVGLAAVSDEHYSGSHWLASFAVYLMTARGA